MVMVAATEQEYRDESARLHNFILRMAEHLYLAAEVLSIAAEKRPELSARLALWEKEIRLVADSGCLYRDQLVCVSATDLHEPSGGLDMPGPPALSLDS